MKKIIINCDVCDTIASYLSPITVAINITNDDGVEKEIHMCQSCEHTLRDMFPQKSIRQIINKQLKGD